MSIWGEWMEEARLWSGGPNWCLRKLTWAPGLVGKRNRVSMRWLPSVSICEEKGGKQAGLVEWAIVSVCVCVLAVLTYKQEALTQPCIPLWTIFLYFLNNLLPSITGYLDPWKEELLSFLIPLYVGKQTVRAHASSYFAPSLSVHVQTFQKSLSFSGSVNNCIHIMNEFNVIFMFVLSICKLRFLQL